MERTILYSENGDCYHGDNNSFIEAKKLLKSKGYKKAYSGRKFNNFGFKVLVGINEKNAVHLSERRKNGLFNARIINL